MSEKGYHHGDLRNALVQAGLGLLERGGPGAVGLRAVARDVGVSQAAPYAHFRSKRELMSVIAAAGFAKLRDMLAPLATDPASSLNELGFAYVEFATGNPGLYSLMFGSGEHVDTSNEELARSGREAFDLLALRTARQDAGTGNDPGPLAAWALVHGLSMLLIDEKLPPGAKHSLPEILKLLEPGITAHLR